MQLVGDGGDLPEAFPDGGHISLARGQSIVNGALDRIIASHDQTFYLDRAEAVDATGLESVISKQRRALTSIKSFRIIPRPGDKTAGYHYWYHRMTFYRNPPTDTDVFHEMVHAVDDVNDWYAMGYESSERLAYGAEAMLRVGLRQLHIFHHQYLVPKSGTPSELNSQWHRSWKEIAARIPEYPIDYKTVYSQKTSTLRMSDLNDVKSKLGFSLSAKFLTAVANGWLKRHGREPCLTVPDGLPLELQ